MLQELKDAIPFSWLRAICRMVGHRHPLTPGFPGTKNDHGWCTRCDDLVNRNTHRSVFEVK